MGICWPGGGGLRHGLRHSVPRAEDWQHLVHRRRHDACAQGADDAPPPGLAAERRPLGRHLDGGERLRLVAAQARGAVAANHGVGH
jgi:hypothetical protein